MGRNQQMSEVDAKFYKMKMKQFKRAKQNGNDGRAERIAVELEQYFGNSDSETPIVREVENIGSNFEQLIGGE